MNYEKSVYSSKYENKIVDNFVKIVFLNSSKTYMSKIKKRED